MIVPCEGADHVRGLAGERGGDCSGGAWGAVAAGQPHHGRVPAGALDEGDHRALVVPADYQIALPSAGLGSGAGGSGPVGYGPVVAQSTAFGPLAAAARLAPPAGPGKLLPRAGLQSAASGVVEVRPVDRLSAHLVA